MKTLIIYDSAYNNTEKIALAVGKAITGEVKVAKIDKLNNSELEGLDLLIVGAPTYGGRPTPPIISFLDSIPNNLVKGLKVAAFDTRLSTRLVKVFGYAAPKIAGKLKNKGGIPVLPPEGFFVKATEGPLKDSELERAAAWAKTIW
jgi:flavodoxin I